MKPRRTEGGTGAREMLESSSLKRLRKLLQKLPPKFQKLLPTFQKLLLKFLDIFDKRYLLLSHEASFFGIFTIIATNISQEK